MTPPAAGSSFPPVRRLIALSCAAAGLLAGLAPAASAAPSTVDVQILGFNDFHGNLEPPSGSSGRIGNADGTTTDAGGAAYLATHIKTLRAENPKRTITVSSGDLIGASPFISALFHDEPTVEAMNKIGLQVSAVGNHEFDEGYKELLRMQNGRCHPVDGCQDGDPFFGANFQWLAANVTFLGTDRTILPRYWVRGVGNNVRIGFIGLTLEGTPTIVTPAGVAGLKFLPEVQTVNRYADLLQRKGVRSIVVLIHEGGQQNPPYATGFQDINGCENFSGAIVPIVEGLSDKVDVVASAHTHNAYNCTINGKLVTSAASFGRLITDIDLKVSTKNKDVVSATATNRIVTRDVPADPAVQKVIDKYKTLSTPIGNRVVGTSTADLNRAPNAAGESTLGDVIADSQLAGTQSAGAQIAFMNPGGIRADLLAGELTYAELFAVQPFNNLVNAKTMTGDEIRRVLEQQFDNPGPGQSRILQVSTGFTYSYDLTRPAGQRVSDLALNGVPIDPAATYRVTMNSFLSTGGDNFTVFAEGTDEVVGPIDIDILEDYIAATGVLSPPPLDRITRLG